MHLLLWGLVWHIEELMNTGKQVWVKRWQASNVIFGHCNNMMKTDLLGTFSESYFDVSLKIHKNDLGVMMSFKL